MHNNNRIGDIAETYAAAYLGSEGYEVFPNFGCSGPADLVIWSKEDNEFIAVDVKRINPDKITGWGRINIPPKTPEQLGLDVLFLLVFLRDDGGVDRFMWDWQAEEHNARLPDKRHTVGKAPPNRLMIPR